MRDMYERAYGGRYSEAGGAKEAAAIIRAELRDDIKRAAHHSGRVGTHPMSAVSAVSVRYRTASMMQAIDVEIDMRSHLIHAIDGNAVWNRDQEFRRVGHVSDQTAALFVCRVCGSDRLRFTAGRTDDGPESPVLAALAYVESKVWAFNHDGSESQVDYFDVRFYSSVNAFDVRPEGFTGERWQRVRAGGGPWCRDLLERRAGAGEVAAIEYARHPLIGWVPEPVEVDR